MNFDDLLLRNCNAVYNQKTMESLYPLFLKKRDLEIAKIYRDITLNSIAAILNNGLLLNQIEPETERILWKNQNVFWRNRSATSQIVTTRRIVGIWAKIQEATLLFVDFSKAFDSIHTGKKEQMLIANNPS